MNYQHFFAEIANWIERVNQMAMQHGMESDHFWNWVTSSMAVIAEKYGNNPLVVKQLAMLYSWLDDVYIAQKKSG